jgi:glyoxylase-like metal-dependent hydrolase (beta-lactamase superfamily II)
VTVERVLAPNPSIFTGPGTNTYLVADGTEVTVIDPGPVIQTHLLAIVEAIGDRTVVAVIATHTHSDHAPLSNPLAALLGCPVLGYGPGPEFEPDVQLADGDEVRVGAHHLRAVHTPGHSADHLCFQLSDRLFTGDHIMGGSTVVMADASAYLESLYRVQDLGVARIEPGHGDSMDDAGHVIAEYIEHRLAREQEILDVIGAGAGTIADIVDVVYAFVPADLKAAATHQVIVQLNKLLVDDKVRFSAGAAGPSTMVELIARQ